MATTSVCGENILCSDFPCKCVIRLQWVKALLYHSYIPGLLLTYILFLVFLSPLCTCIGSDRDDHIRSTIVNCKGLIAIISDNYVKSDDCTKELKIAHESKKTIFPVIHKNVDFNQSEKVLRVKSILGGSNSCLCFHFLLDDATSYSRTLSRLVYTVTKRGKQGVPSTEVHLKLPVVFPLVFFLCFGFVSMHAYR